MKTTIITSILVLLILMGCNSKEKEALNFKDFNLELPEWNLDLSKPHSQTYGSDLGRDSIVTEASDAIFEIDTNSVNEKDSKIVFLMLDFSAESKTVVSRFIKNEKDINLTSWKALPVSKDVNSMNKSMKEIINKNPTVSITIKRDLNLKEVFLFYKIDEQ